MPIPKLDKDIGGWGELQIILIKTDLKIFKKILVNQNQQYIKRITYHDRVGFITVTQGGLTFKNQPT